MDFELDFRPLPNNLLNSDDDMLSVKSEDDNEFQPLSEHACYYCLIQDSKCVVKCLTCNRWFCNSYGGGNFGSHIIFHLIKSRHRAIQMHPDNNLSDSNIECFSCNTQNVFLLGLVPSKSESTLIFLCRDPCVM